MQEVFDAAESLDVKTLALEATLAAAGAVLHIERGWPAARLRLWSILSERGVRRVLVGPGLPGVADELRRDFVIDEPTADRPTLFAADAGVSSADWLVSETGTLVLQARPDQPRSLSLLPPLHVALVPASKLVPDLFDLFAEQERLPSCLSLVTGPSKTGDIELRLVTGVHGPGEVHVVLVADA
ncbi:MAG: lactate utilization protein, partial [Thermoleophilia bacterium]|nr:lactate utilization protein [Thermoleophilia bacterium]